MNTNNLDNDAKEFVAERLAECQSFNYGGEFSMTLEMLESLLLNTFIHGQLSGVHSIIGDNQ